MEKDIKYLSKILKQNPLTSDNNSLHYNKLQIDKIDKFTIIKN